MRIWFDCDGVLARFTDVYIGILNSLTGRSHTVDDVTDWEFASCVASVREDAEVWKVFDSSPGLVQGLVEYDGVADLLRQVRAIPGVRVGCLTTPHIGPHWMYDRAKWLMDRGFTKREIVFCSDKCAVPGAVLIEDSYDNAANWQSSHPTSLAILVDRPWNRHTTFAARARSNDHILDLIHMKVEAHNVR